MKEMKKIYETTENNEERRKKEENNEEMIINGANDNVNEEIMANIMKRSDEINEEK